MNEDVKSENVRIHSRADELIACLEGEIAKRDEVIVGLTNSRDFWREKAIAADDELAATKAQGVVMPEPMKRGDEGGSGEYGAAMIRGYNACLREVARLNSAPAAPAADAGIVDMYRHLQKVTPYRFKKIQDASITDGGDVMYFHKDRFDAALLADMAAHCAAKGVV